MLTRFSSDLTALDWAVLSGYFVLLAMSGLYFTRRARKHTKDTDDYFLAGRRMPVWAVGISIVATSMSAASFIGVPQQGYTSDLTYLTTNIGMVIAAFVVAFVFIPAFYRRRVRTIYELLDQRYGRGAMQATSGAYMLGRIMASGVRVFIGAIPASIMLFGADGLEPGNLCIAIGVLTVVGIVYTLAGGIASVIWTDVIQMAILLGACVLAIGLIAAKLPIGAGEAMELLRSPGDGQPSKLTLFQAASPGNPWWTLPFSLPAVIVGFTLMGIASYGTDQDLTQRMLTCKDEKSAARSVIGGILFGIPSVGLFLVVGLLLWLFYQNPQVWATHAIESPAIPEDSRRVFLSFIIDHMPAGVSGLMMAGLFAAGLSSLNSGINAMASTFINDFYRRIHPDKDERHYLRAGRWAVVGWGLVLGGFAVVCVFWQTRDGELQEGGTLLTFALSVMTFAYAGLIPVFLTALLTRRGSTESVIATLITGFVIVLAMQSIVWDPFVDIQSMRDAFLAERLINPDATRPFLLGVIDLAFVWKLAIASTVAMAVSLSFPGSDPQTERL
ncbi:MAG: sodium:solute symporter [Phycisphaerales bacterium]|nr:sodium:solute symporter [Planctomycetota bacterium]MCH8508339.1 sodium:solute symporter [Phycisphaerales bacterium]